jgi:gliding motility-associated lipoprotein GldB
MRTIAISLCLAFIFTSCRKEKCSIDPGVLKIPVNLELIRLEQKLSAFKSKEDAIQFINDWPEFSESFLERSQYPNDSILAESLYKLSIDPYVDTLFQEAREVFGDMKDLKEELAMAFRHIKKHYPDFKEPRVYTAITGLGNDLFVSDSVIVIGLDYFLGKNATFRPKHLPEYILRRYEKEYIVPNIILLMSKKFNATDYQNNTMLAEMIFYGKAYYFTKSMMPCTADSLLIGYSGEEISDVRDHETIIWANFIENQLLYETSHFTKNKFLGERPKVFEIGTKCPGRIGAWVGWEIVNSYMSRNKVTLTELMSDSNVNEIFAQSRYRPGRRR